MTLLKNDFEDRDTLICRDVLRVTAQRIHLNTATKWMVFLPIYAVLLRWLVMGWQLRNYAAAVKE